MSETFPLTAAPAARRRSIWRDSDFLRLWCGETASQIGSQVSTLALPLIAIITLHAPPIMVGVLSAAQFAPNLAVTLFAGLWLEHHRRRPAMLAANLGRLVLLTAIPVLHLLGLLTIWLLCGIVFLVGTLSSVFDIAYLVYLPSLIENDQMVDANSKLEATYSVAQIGGPGVGGLLVQVFTAPFAVLADAVSYLIAAVSIASIRQQEPVPGSGAEREPMRTALALGFRSLFGNRYLRPVTLESAWTNLFEQATLTLTLIYVVRHLHLTAGLIGAIMAIGSVGGLGGALVAERYGRWLGTGRALGTSMIVAALGLAAVPAAGGDRKVISLVLIAGFALYGFGVATYNVYTLSLRIAACPEPLLARVTACYRFVVYGTIPLGGLLGGLLGGTVGLRPGLIVCVSALLAAAVAFAFTPIRKITDLQHLP